MVPVQAYLCRILTDMACTSQIYIHICSTSATKPCHILYTDTVQQLRRPVTHNTIQLRIDGGAPGGSSHSSSPSACPTQACPSPYCRMPTRPHSAQAISFLTKALAKRPHRGLAQTPQGRASLWPLQPQPPLPTAPASMYWRAAILHDSRQVTTHAGSACLLEHTISAPSQACVCAAAGWSFTRGLEPVPPPPPQRAHPCCMHAMWATLTGAWPRRPTPGRRARVP